MSADKYSRAAGDLDLTADEAAQVRGGMLPIEPGGDVLNLGVPRVVRKRKKKKAVAPRWFPGEGGRPAP